MNINQDVIHPILAELSHGIKDLHGKDLRQVTAALLNFALANRAAYNLTLPYLMKHLFLISESIFTCSAMAKLLRAHERDGISKGCLNHVKSITVSLGGGDDDKGGDEDEDADLVEIREPLLIEILLKTASNLEDLHLYLCDDDPSRAIPFLSQLAKFTALKKFIFTPQCRNLPLNLSSMRLPPNIETFTLVGSFISGHGRSIDFKPLYKQLRALPSLKEWKLADNYIESHVNQLISRPSLVAKLVSVSDVFPLERLLSMPEFNPRSISMRQDQISPAALVGLTHLESLTCLRFDDFFVPFLLASGLPPNLQELTLFRPQGAIPASHMREFKKIVRNGTANPLPIKLIGHQTFDMQEGRFWWSLGKQIEWWWPEPH